MTKWEGACVNASGATISQGQGARSARVQSIPKGNPAEKVRLSSFLQRAGAEDVAKGKQNAPPHNDIARRGVLGNELRT